MFGRNLKKLREQRGLIQADVGKGIGVEQQQISKWETGALEPDIHHLCALADFFGVSVDYLVGHVPPQPEDSTAQMRKLLDSLTPEQVTLLCAIAARAVNGADRAE